MSDEVKFTAHERMALRLPQSEPMRGREAELLRKIIDTAPIILNVAQCNFDPLVAAYGIRLQAAEFEFEAAVHAYHEKQSTPPANNGDPTSANREEMKSEPAT